MVGCLVTFLFHNVTRVVQTIINSSLSRCQLWIKDDDGEIYGVNIEHVVVIDEKIETLKIADEYVGKDQNEILGN